MAEDEIKKESEKKEEKNGNGNSEDLAKRREDMKENIEAKKLIDGGGMLGWGAKKAVLLAINAAVAKMTEDPSVSVDEEGLMWLLSQVG